MSAILDNLSQMAGRHNTAGPFTILRVVRKLNGIQRPNICAKTAHGKFGGAVARMSENNMGLDSEDILHFYLNIKNKGVISHSLL